MHKLLLFLSDKRTYKVAPNRQYGQIKSAGLWFLSMSCNLYRPDE